MRTQVQSTDTQLRNRTGETRFEVRVRFPEQPSDAVGKTSGDVWHRARRTRLGVSDAARWLSTTRWPFRGGFITHWYALPLMWNPDATLSVDRRSQIKLHGERVILDLPCLAVDMPIA